MGSVVEGSSYFVPTEMEFQPQSQHGKRLLPLLKTWIEKSPESAVDKLKRVFITFSVDVRNEDKFVTFLYGQNALNESPSVLVKVKILH